VDADTETPVSAFQKVSRGQNQAFLFESVEGGERSARWSFLGAGPRSAFAWRLADGGEPLARVERELSACRAVPVEGTPRFSGGLVGYLSYDAVRTLEPRVPIGKPDEHEFPDAVFMDFDTVLAFDGVRHTIQIIAQARWVEGVDPRVLYRDALERSARVLQSHARGEPEERPAPSSAGIVLRPRTPRADFEEAVRAARERIRAGDCQQIVLSQRFDTEVDVPPFELYRALRRVNPSPYLFYVQDGPRALVGSSPETLVRLEDGDISLRPLAGTRRRGRTLGEDAALEAELRADPKENAEHVMLVDLGRNDVGRVAEMGSVRVDVLREVERYSHVMHLVSQVSGRLAPGKSAVDVLRATFPAGTVSGAPKVRAMEIIDALEPARRGPYAGCVGYFDRAGNMQMAITIRTLLKSGRRVSVQAGAGVVFDSSPEAEYQETLNKARALLVALVQAHRGSLQKTAADVTFETAETP
jgi:anthranilate synthase component 1